jgi:hypothetical protein
MPWSGIRPTKPARDHRKTTSAKKSSAQFGKARGELFGRVENTGTGQRIRFFAIFPGSVFHKT